MKNNVQRTKHVKMLNKHKISVSVYCILPTVTYKTKKIHRYYGLAMQRLGDRKVLKCQEYPNMIAYSSFMRK